MIELNKSYSTKTLAEAMNISYQWLRQNRKEYEEHLSKFYKYNIESKGNSIYYTFFEELYSYVPYREYKSIQKNTVIRRHIKDTIYYDNRQTGSNIARIIIVDGEIQALNLQLSTLTVYVRDELKSLVKAGYYKRDDYKWCYLDKKKNQYILMSENEIKQLRSYFHTRQAEEEEENILSCQEQGGMTQEEADKAVAELRKSNFIQGRQYYQEVTGRWPIKVPVYERNGLIPD